MVLRRRVGTRKKTKALTDNQTTAVSPLELIEAIEI